MTWDDYLEQGAMKAIDVAREITRRRPGQRARLLRRRARSSRARSRCCGAQASTIVASMTLLTTMLDFADPGEIGVFIDRADGGGARSRDRQGRRCCTAASSPRRSRALRANDLVWPYVVNNYLKGETPPAFDLLYWNADATNLPGPMFCWYLRNTVPGEQAARAGRADDVRRAGRPRATSTVRPTSTRRARTTSCRGARRTSRTRLLGGDRPFVLGASGHIAGVINPPAKNKRNYWTDGARRQRRRRVARAARRRCPAAGGPTGPRGSRATRASKVPAPKARDHREYAPIEPAPGRYVKEKSD